MSSLIVLLFSITKSRQPKQILYTDMKNNFYS